MYQALVQPGTHNKGLATQGDNPEGESCIEKRDKLPGHSVEYFLLRLILLFFFLLRFGANSYKCLIQNNRPELRTTCISEKSESST